MKRLGARPDAGIMTPSWSSKMNRPFSVLAVALLTTTLSFGSMAQAQRAATPPAEMTMPSAEVTPQEAYVRMVARNAYSWGWPMVNMLNRRTSITKAPHPGLLGGILPVAPQGQLAMLHDYVNPDQRAVACPNQDVVYGLGFFDLDSQPVVLQVPEFRDRFWVYAIYDQRTDQVGQLGKPYGTKPGFYLLAGPNWQGELPQGVTDVVRSPTSLANIIPRIFMNDTDEDRAATRPTAARMTGACAPGSPCFIPRGDAGADPPPKSIRLSCDCSRVSDVPASGS